MSRAAAAGLLVSVAVAVGSASAVAARIVGTPRNDVLRGTAKADHLDGRGGHDRLFGLAGDDLLVGGPGNDLLTGGPGVDRLRCGPGWDVAVVAAGDRVGVDCEAVRGLPSLSVADAAVDEPDFGPATLAITVKLSAPVSHPVSVQFATGDGTATTPSDYGAVAGTLTFAPRETTKTIAVTVIGDTDFEPDETFTVTLTSPVDATLTSRRATVTIRNDDLPPPRPGRYTGTTSQSRSIGFEVSVDGQRLTQLTLSVFVNCPRYGRQLPEDFAFATLSVPISPINRRVGGNLQYTHPAGGRVYAYVEGTFVTSAGTAASTASGSFRLTYVVDNVGCASDTVTWNASSP